ncbi:MAG: circularly permuted type 2 ATP-grasp protein [Rhodocyclaceae bacterium]|nr:circularly permuted type 2 ATP-grasp protein [Rhodocyclaceae bacterium]
MPSQLLATYPRATGRYDEMFEFSGRVRPHWQALFDALVASRPEQMARRQAYVQNQIFENGITYNVYADSKGAERPWDLDLLPYIIPGAEWQKIEAAVVQRATLLNRILADVYGNQYLLREGLLPPALVHGHAGFLRPAHGIPSPDGIHLHLYAADLARSPDGQWWVIADRTQAPSGAGYALENRLILSRVFPELFRDLRVQHLASFFHTLQESLSHWAPRDDGTDSPRIVLLTPGPYNETYFEHAYLARYLGFPLVEGHDLTVRDGCVWLKSLEGLQRVHVILRRLDDDFCDPLELRADSALGIPGLAQAARDGKVLIANALGSSLLESGALYGYLPGLCRRILGEPLLMPSVATWWCGEPAALEDALEKLDHLVIKGAFPQLRMDSVFGSDLSEKAKKKLIAAMRERPYQYVAQETVHLSQAPRWDRGHPRRLDSRAMGLRVHVVASPNGYVVMPGGLTRVAGVADARIIALQRGGASKDTWVMSDAPVSDFSLLASRFEARNLVRSGANLSSRVVENLFWFGRYAERCDNVARLLRTALARSLAEGNAGEGQGSDRGAILALCRECELLPADDADFKLEPSGKGSPVTEDVALLASLTDPDIPGGFAANLRQLVRIGFNLRERLSLDNWRTLNRLAQDLEAQRGSQAKEPDLGEALAFLDQAVTALMTLAGFALDGMTRDMGWRFLSIGRRLERLQFMTTLLLRSLDSEHRGGLDWLLELADSIITYRSRYMMRPEPLPVMDLLLLDEANPRAVLFQVRGLVDYGKRLTEQFGPCGSESLARYADRLREMDLAQELSASEGRELRDVLVGVRDAAALFSDHLGQRFFSHVAEQNIGAD